MKVSGYDIAYQAQNLVYMYSLGLVDTLDIPLIRDIRDTTVRNGYRKDEPVLDGILPIFAEAIGMKDEISLDDVHDARDYYLSKRPIAETILQVSREFKIRFKDLTLSRI